MPSNFICKICKRAFNTNQHLTQHINRKKKCTPFDKKGDDGDSTTTSSLTDTHISPIEEGTIQYTNIPEVNLIISNLISKDVLGNTSISIPNLIEFVIKYKNLLDDELKYEKKIAILEDKLKFIEHQNHHNKAFLNKFRSLCLEMNTHEENYENFLKYELLKKNTLSE